MSEPTKKQIEDQLAQAIDASANGSKWPGMSYEEGVAAALRWVLGESDEKPMEDE